MSSDLSFSFGVAFRLWRRLFPRFFVTRGSSVSLELPLVRFLLPVTPVIRRRRHSEKASLPLDSPTGLGVSAAICSHRLVGVSIEETQARHTQLPTALAADTAIGNHLTSLTPDAPPLSRLLATVCCCATV